MKKLFCLILVISLAVAGYVYRDRIMDEFQTRLQDETATTSVTADGFTVDKEINFLGKRQSIRVTGPAGVAPAGTTVAVHIAHNRETIFPGQEFGIFEPVGHSMDITLGNGSIQPSVPIVVSVEVPDGNALDDETVLAFTDGTDGDLEPLPVTATRSNGRMNYTTTMAHLSGITFANLSPANLLKLLEKGMQSLAGEKYDAPGCMGEEVTVNGVTLVAEMPRRLNSDNSFSDDIRDVVWPCLKPIDNGVAVVLNSSGAASLEVSGNPRWSRAFPIFNGATDSLTAAATMALGERSNVSYVQPGQSTQLEYPTRNLPHIITLSSSPGPLLTQAFFWTLDNVPTLGWPKKLDKINTARSVVDCAYEGGAAIAAQSSTDILKSHAGCLATIAGKAGSFGYQLVMSVFSTAFQIIYSSIDGVVRTFMGEDRFGIEVKQSASDNDVSSSQINFRSPTGNILCQMSGSDLAGQWGGGGIGRPDVACLANEYTGDNILAYCDSSTITKYSGAAAIGRSKNPVRGLCTGGQPFSGSGIGNPEVLDYGKSLQWNGFTCSSDYTSGITCIEDSTASGFVISRDAVKLMGGDATRYAEMRPDDSPMDADLGLYSDEWAIKGLSLNLLPNWTGQLRRNSGAIDNATWNVTWEKSGTAQARVTIGALTSSNSPLSDELQPGSAYDVKVSGTPKRMTISGPVSGSGSGRSLDTILCADDRRACPG
ncbi:hypothetical protein [Rhodococcus sp. 24CO]|uniref:hypothetical protein n=1 Tax=Rhodococcus sp. 24CO TaxID=3117460 RepID=UPI003D329DBE